MCVFNSAIMAALREKVEGSKNGSGGRQCLNVKQVAILQTAAL